MHSDDSGEQEYKSKSQLKREAHALQDSGQKLIALPDAALRALDIPEALLKAVLEAKRINSHGALRRQRQYIGRLMRELDTEHLLQQIDQLEQNRRADTARFHAIEHWRDRLLSEQDEALQELLKLHPDADRQHLRQLMRQAQKQTSDKRAPRALFEYLKELLSP